MSAREERLIWIDLEMTGLRPARDAIIEIATIVTDWSLEIVAEGPVMAIWQPEAILAGMDDWNRKQHSQSGLLARVRQSPHDLATAEQATLAFLREHVGAGSSPMCGNSICQDRRFLAAAMPTLEAYFHYRHIDVSTFKQLAKYWAPEVAANLVKPDTHRALDDIRASIDELRYYRRHLWKTDPQIPPKDNA